MALVDVNGAALWVEEQGSGPVVVFVHGGLGDSRLWEPQATALASRFRTVRYDLRFFGRSTSPGVAFSMVDDLVRLLDALEIERAALVGLSLGGGLVIDVALAHPDRVGAIVHVAGGVSGRPLSPYTDEQDAEFEAAIGRGDLDTAMAIDFAVWAPLGADQTFRELWQAVPEARGLPDGAEFLPAEPAYDRLDQIHVPTLVIGATHDPVELRDIGIAVAERIPDATRVEIDSDHYLTLREPERVAQLIEEFLTLSVPAAAS